MAIVTFPIELGGSGLVVSDDTDPITGLRNGGYLTRFVPALQQTVAVAGFVVGQTNAAASSATAASGFATAAGVSATNSANSAASAANSFLTFDNRQLGAKAANPTTDNYGGVLIVGATYFNTTAMETRVWNGTTWQSAATVGGVVNSLTVTGALEYQGTLTGGTGVINIGGGQIYKDASGNVAFGETTVDDIAIGYRTVSLKDTNGAGLRLYAGATENGRLYSDASGLYLQAVGAAVPWYAVVNNAIRLIIDTAGNAGLGVTPSAWGATFKAIQLGISGSISGRTGNETVVLGSGVYFDALGAKYLLSGNSASFYQQASGAHIWNTAPPGTAGNPITFTESARITSGSYFKASNTGTYFGATSAYHEFVSDANNIIQLNSTSNTGAAVIGYASALVSGATGQHFAGIVNGATVFQVESSGTVRNATAVYGAISDPKLKDIIGPKSSTWEKTKQYNWIEYYLKSDADHAFKMLGLNAEEAAAISPGVVDESPDLVEVTKVRQVPVQIVRLDENENPVVDEETGEVIYDKVMVDEEYTEWEPNGEFTKSVKYSVVSMQYHRTTQECQQRIEDLEAAKVQTDDLIQQIMGRVAALESASA